MKRTTISIVLAGIAGLAVGFTPAVSATEDQSSPKTTTAKPQKIRFSGALSKVSETQNTITVKSSTTTKTFTLAPDLKIVIKDNPQAMLSALKPGDCVDVVYTMNDDVMTAKQIKRVTEPPKHAM